MKKDHVKNDVFIKIIILQSICVALFLILAVILRLIGGGLYENAKEKYFIKYFDDTFVSDVSESFEAGETAVGRYLVEAKDGNAFFTPLSGKITSVFGLRDHPVSHEYKEHGGIDIGVEEGTKIAAALKGTVAKIGESGSYGKYVLLDHGNGLETMYAHCSDITVKEGDEVLKGSLIAFSGNTGVTTGPHLHFEVRICGEKVDPLMFMDTYEL